MVGKKPTWFWNIMTISWKYICPLSLIVCFINNLHIEFCLYLFSLLSSSLIVYSNQLILHTKKGIIVSTFIIPSSKLSLKGIEYPGFAIFIGWIIVLIPIMMIVFCALYQGFKCNWDWVGTFLCFLKLFCVVFLNAKSLKITKKKI
jgi:hypothetical protein